MNPNYSAPRAALLKADRIRLTSQLAVTRQAEATLKGSLKAKGITAKTGLPARVRVKER